MLILLLLDLLPEGLFVLFLLAQYLVDPCVFLLGLGDVLLQEVIDLLISLLLIDLLIQGRLELTDVVL